MSRPPAARTSRLSRSISRRTLLSLVGAAAAGSAGLIFLRRGRETLHPWERETLEQLRPRLAAAGAPSVLGPVALETVGEETPGELARHLFRAPSRFRGRDVESALASLRDQIRGDYAMGRTLPVADWELSQTEARLFAVLHTMDRRSDRSRS